MLILHFTFLNELLLEKISNQNSSTCWLLVCIIYWYLNLVLLDRKGFILMILFLRLNRIGYLTFASTFALNFLYPSTNSVSSHNVYYFFLYQHWRNSSYVISATDSIRMISHITRGVKLNAKKPQNSHL